MEDTDKTKEQLIGELRDIRHQIIELEKERTEHRKLQEALSEREQLLQKAQAISHLGHFKFNPNTNVVEGSDELFNIFGLSREDFQFSDFVSTVHPNDRDFVISTIQRSIEKRENYDIEHSLILRDGTLKFIKANGEPVLDSAGNTAFMVGTVQDITERNQEKEDLSERNRFIASLINLSPDIVYIYDLIDKKNVYINKGIQKVLDYSIEDIQKMGNHVIPILMHPDDLKVYFEETVPRYAKAQDKELILHQYRMKNSSGNWHWLDCAELIYHRQSDGSPHQIFGVIRDITERKKAIEELQKAKDEMEERVKDRTSELELAIECLNEEIHERKKAEHEIKINELRLSNAQRVGHLGFWDWNIVTGDLYWSDETFTIYGFKPQEFISTFEKFESILFPDDQEYILKKVDEALNKDVPYNVDFRFIYPDGNIGWIHVEGEVDRNEKGEAIRFFGTQIDITASKRNEEALKKAKEEIETWNKELEKRVREKTEELGASQAQLIQSEKLSAMGQMAGGLAHELNSPLAGLLPMLEQYKNKAAKDSREYIEFSLMFKASEYMAKIVRDFSSFARESKGEYFELNLNELIDDTLNFITSRFKQKGIQIIKEYEDVLPKIKGEKTELQQVILNIVTNALDAMLEGGRFIIRTVSKNNKVSMEFIDNGLGIEEEYINRIFDPFYTTKRPGKGTGLGLSVSYKIIEKHGGDISVESDPGKGTKFTVHLPAVKSNAKIKNKQDG